MWNKFKVKRNSLLIYLFCQLFFLFNLENPRGFNFDEFHYVPSAKQFLGLQTNQNWEHPPLGKLLMAVGIGLAGDNQIGWRIMSTIFGSLTAVGMYWMALILFKSQEAALWALALTLVNHLLYVQARIGMLDTFMFTFLIWAMVAFTATWLPAPGRWKNSTLLRIMGALLGLTIACKWFGIVAWGACLILFLGIKLIQHTGVLKSSNDSDTWNPTYLWKDVSWFEFGLSFLIIPAVFYFLTFTPFLFIQDGVSHSPLEWWEMQFRMYDGQLRVITSHPYMSDWIGWPLMVRPIWYAFEPELGDPGYVRGVLLLGNPIIMWLGLLALIPCLIDGLVLRRLQALLVVFFWSAFFLCWSLIPRKIAFYYYYYPAGMMLTFAMTYVFFQWKGKIAETLRRFRLGFLVACLVMFIFYFPVLGALRIPSNSFLIWTWFKSWI